MNKSRTVVVVVIETGSDMETHVCANWDIAWRKMHDYIKENWDEDSPCPDDPTEAYEAYFDGRRSRQGEWMHSEEAPIEDDSGPQLYAMVSWTPGDVQSLRESWSLERCEEELDRAESRFRDCLIDRGWEILNDLLPVEEEEDGDE